MKLRYRKNKGMIIKLIEDFFEIDSFDGYNNTIYRLNNNIVLPYVNLSIFNSNYSFIKTGDRLEYSFLVFKGVKEVRLNYSKNENFKSRNIIFSYSQNDDCLVEYLSGNNIFGGGCEITIFYKEGYIYIPKEVRIKNDDSHWVPIKTPNFPINIDENESNVFFSKKCIPQDIMTFLGINNKEDFRDLLLPSN